MPKTEHLYIRIEPSEKDAAQRAAEANRRTLGDWVREIVREAAQQYSRKPRKRARP